MNLFVLNCFLALCWTAIQDYFTLTNLIIGFFIGHFVLMVSWPLFGNKFYFIRFWKGLRFPFYFLFMLIKSSFEVMSEVLTPGLQHKPGIIALPLNCHTNLEITFLSYLITLNPGTLSMHVSRDKKTLYIHAMFISDLEEVKMSIKNGLEKNLLEVMR